MIGVAVQIASPSGGNSGVGFAVPINTVQRVVNGIIENGVFTYAWLGISGTELDPLVRDSMNLPKKGGTGSRLVNSFQSFLCKIYSALGNRGEPSEFRFQAT